MGSRIQYNMLTSSLSSLTEDPMRPANSIQQYGQYITWGSMRSVAKNRLACGRSVQMPLIQTLFTADILTLTEKKQSRVQRYISSKLYVQIRDAQLSARSASWFLYQPITLIQFSDSSINYAGLLLYLSAVQYLGHLQSAAVAGAYTNFPESNWVLKVIINVIAR